MKELKAVLLSTASPMAMYYGPVWGAQSVLAVKNLFEGLKVVLPQEEILIEQ